MNSQIVNLNCNFQQDYGYREAIKTLRSNIQFCGNSIHTILFTSSMPDEGKSDISLSAAQALAQIGKKTLLVDADIRKSVLADRYMPGQEVVGLSQYLSDQKELDEVIYKTTEENLYIMFAGPYAPNPAELLSEEMCAQMFEILRVSYDYVIVDTPPMGSLIDGAVVARYCDGAVMVIESGAISYRLEQKVKNQLERAGCRILGAVLNKVDIRNERYYGKYGRYGRYGKYGRYKKYGEEKESHGLIQEQERA